MIETETGSDETHHAQNHPAADGRSRRRRLFRFLAVLWVFPSLGALLILGGGFFSRAAAVRTWSDWKTIRFEEYIGIGLLLAQVIFVVLARGARPGRSEATVPEADR